MISIASMGLPSDFLMLGIHVKLLEGILFVINSCKNGFDAHKKG
jgi:hypothetical protein